jgi:hypothetical protein
MGVKGSIARQRVFYSSGTSRILIPSSLSPRWPPLTASLTPPSLKTSKHLLRYP